jgi:hypothetical protein
VLQVLAVQAMPLETADDVDSNAVTVDSAALGGNEVIEWAGMRRQEVERRGEGDPAALAAAALDSTVSSVFIVSIA